MQLKNVIDIKKINLNKEVLDLISDSAMQKIAKNNAKQVDVFRIIYKSGKNKIVGFILEPKNKGNKNFQ